MTQPVLTIPRHTQWQELALYTGGFAACCALSPTFATGAVLATPLLFAAIPLNLVITHLCRTDPPPTPRFFSNIIRAPLVEEITYRGIVENSINFLTKAPLVGRITTSLLFGASHVHNTAMDTLTFVYATAVSLLFLSPIAASAGLIASIAAHALHNLSLNICNAAYYEITL